jgi:hypothetical protein
VSDNPTQGRPFYKLWIPVYSFLVTFCWLTVQAGQEVKDGN